MLVFLKNWIEGIAVAVIITSIFEMILPEGNIKKYIKMVLGIYVLFSIIAPFVNSKDLYSINMAEYIEESSKETSATSNVKTENNLNEMYKEAFEKEIKKTIEREGYKVISCKVDADFDTNENSGINSIKIVISSKENNEKIEKVEITINSTEESQEDKITENEINNLKEILFEQYELDKKIIDIQTK